MKLKFTILNKKFLIFGIIFLIVVLLFLIVFSYKMFHPYPVKYTEDITFAGNQYNVSSSLIASVIFAESNYNQDAKSNKGAIGLMQILPTTAMWLAEKMNITFSVDDLYDAKYNINMGTLYLSYLFNKFHNIDTVLASYNAGEGNVSLWLVNNKYSKDGKTLVTTPFKETNLYIKKVKNANKFYSEYFNSIN